MRWGFPLPVACHLHPLFAMPHGTWAWCTRFGHFGCPPVEHQGVWVTCLDNPTPLFPHNGCSLARSKLASVLAVKSSFISFHIRPFGTGIKIDEFFLLLHPRLSKVAQARLHFLDCFVVDSKEPMNR